MIVLTENATANDLSTTVMPCIRSTDYYVKQYGYGCRRSRGRQDWQFILTLSGSGIVENQNETFRCEAGDMVVIPPGTPHLYYTEQNQVWEKIWVHFVPRIAWKPWIEYAFHQNRVTHIQFDAPILQKVEYALRRMLDYYTSNWNEFKHELALNSIEEIILLMAGTQSEKKERQLDMRITKILVYLEEHYSEPIQIEELAKQVFLSPSRLTHLFKHEVGESIIETLTKIRINQAAKLLTSTKLPIIEIAYSVGFHSSNFFCRKFAGCYGVNPMEYRKNLMSS